MFTNQPASGISRAACSRPNVAAVWPAEMDQSRSVRFWHVPLLGVQRGQGRGDARGWSGGRKTDSLVMELILHFLPTWLAAEGFLFVCFLTWTISKVFMDVLQYCFCLMCWFFWLRGMWDLLIPYPLHW